jgi:hypothetical protein
MMFNPLRLTLCLRTALLTLAWVLLASCSDLRELANTQQKDTTQIHNYDHSLESTGALVSAFYGLDDALPFFASYFLCGEFGHRDGMPVVFSQELDLNTVEAGDFAVAFERGTTQVACVTPAPATDQGEFRTLLLVGNFGSMSNPPIDVTVTGNLVSLDHRTNFKNTQVRVTPLEAGPSLVYAEIVDVEHWQLGRQSTMFPFGGGDGCPLGTKQVVRVVWSGGVTKPGGEEIDDLERKAYRVSLIDGSAVTPFAIGDLGDGDNNHELCLKSGMQAQRVEFPAGLLTDPREDLNPATAIVLQHPGVDIHESPIAPKLR